MPNPPWLAANGAPQPYVGHDGWLHVPPEFAKRLDGWTGEPQQSVSQLPAWARKIIHDARSEAAAARTQLRDLTGPDPDGGGSGKPA